MRSGDIKPILDGLRKLRLLIVKRRLREALELLSELESRVDVLYQAEAYREVTVEW